MIAISSLFEIMIQSPVQQRVDFANERLKDLNRSAMPPKVKQIKRTYWNKFKSGTAGTQQQIERGEAPSKQELLQNGAYF